MKGAVALASGLAVAATAYLIAMKERSSPPQESALRPAETTRYDLIASLPEQSISQTRKPDESISQSSPSSEEHAATIRHTLIDVMGPWSEDVAKGLVDRGLAPADGEQIAQRFAEGIADCVLEAVRAEYEARGKPDGEQLSWSQTMAYWSLNRVQSAAMPCAANISQQTGIQFPAEFGSSGSSAGDVPQERQSPPWALEMEGRIRDYIASYSAADIKTAIVNCIEEGCNVTLVGRDIRVFDLEFDVFAERNGFQHAILRGDGGFRLVRLQR